MIKKILVLLMCFPFIITAQNGYNLGLVGTFNWSGLSYDSEGSDIWGWYNPATGIEYALVGLNSGFSVIDLSSPQNPTESFFIQDVNSTWRDIKTWGNHAYITTEGGGGLLIVDLTDLSGQTYTHYTGSFNSAHNIYIDENGVAYIFGADVGNGGAIFLDVATNPMNPSYLGEWDDYYIHDGMARGDTMWVGCIYEGEFYAVDVSDKTNPFTLGHHSTPNNFTHNIWISDDGNHVFTTDEQSDSYIGAYNVEDMNNIQEVDRIQSNPGSNSIPHNTHVDGDFLITSWYRDGTIVHDISDPNNLIQVAYYDSYSGSGNGFDGCWGTYPYLPSGLIVSSDINSSSNTNGKLLIYERGFSSACYLKGNVIDASTSQNISGASIIILNTIIPNNSNSNLFGDYSSGNADPGLFDVVFSMPGYISDTQQVNLSNTQVSILNASLLIDNNVPILGCMNPMDPNYNPNANTSIEFGGEVNNSFSSGDYFNGDQYLIFDAAINFIIKSSVFYAEDNKIITFELRNSSGVVIDDTTHFVTQGQQQLILNFDVPIGNDMQLGISSANSGLYRNDAGSVYPYNIASVMNITGSSAGSPGYYYFYYNIEIEAECIDTLTDVNNIHLEKNLLKIIDVLGREVNPTTNITLFYVYDDGSVMKKIIME
jgi:choice-of-anchor B domain-containing protein